VPLTILMGGIRMWLEMVGDSANGLGFPPCGRAYFLLLRQKKVAKEKATPGYAVGCANFPALLETGGGSGTRAAPSDSPRPLSASFSVARRSTRGPKGVICLKSDRVVKCYGQREKKPKNLFLKLAADAFQGPLRGAEQRRLAGRFRLALSEPQASLASRPASRVAQGIPEGDTDLGVAFSLATFFWPPKRKYARQQGVTPSQIAENKLT
jgi:hypothetical protein